MAPTATTLSDVLSQALKMTYPIGGDIIGRNPNDILVRIVRRGIESQAGLPRKHSDKSLLWFERPWKLFRPVRVEVDFYSTGTFYGYEPFGVEAACSDVGSTGESSRCTEHSVEWYGSVCDAQGSDDLRQLPLRLGSVLRNDYR